MQITNTRLWIPEKRRGGGGALYRAAFIALICTVNTACSLKPWVKPYERERLADPIMQFARDPASASYMHHVYESREAARGAEGSGGGGCGCN